MKFFGERIILCSHIRQIQQELRQAYKLPKRSRKRWNIIRKLNAQTEEIVTMLRMMEDTRIEA